MEKIFDKANLLNSLGELINKKIETIASEKKDHLSLEDDAVEHAKAYRMLGWNWDQIDTILEDMEFEPAIVKEAINRAQTFFEETLKDGPFSMFVLGQLIKLKNGFVGKLLDKYPSKLQVRVNDDDLMVASSQIDIDASMKLKEAFVLRTTANELLKTAQAEDSVELSKNVENSDQVIFSMLSGLLRKIEASKKAISEAKEPFRGNKRVLSSLGLEYAAIENLEEELKDFQVKAANLVDIPETTKILNIFASVNDVLDSFTTDFSVLISNTITDVHSTDFTNKVKQITANVSQVVIPSITKISNELSSLIENLEKSNTSQTINALLKHVNKG